MATDAVYKFLKTQNRPYNSNDVANNLGEKYSKSVVQKSLDKLIERNMIFEKTYGKQKIYCVIQDSKQDVNELRRIENELKRQEVEVMSKKSELEIKFRNKEAELASLKSSLSIEDVKEKKDRLVKSLRDLVNKFEILIKNNGSVDLGETKKRVLKQTEIYNREYLKRKRLCCEIIDSILEGFPGTKKTLYEEIGIEIADV